MKLSSYPGLWYLDILYQFCGTLVSFATVTDRVWVGRIGHTRKTLVFLHIADPTFRP